MSLKRSIVNSKRIVWNVWVKRTTTSSAILTATDKTRWSHQNPVDIASATTTLSDVCVSWHRSLDLGAHLINRHGLYFSSSCLECWCLCLVSLREFWVMKDPWLVRLQTQCWHQLVDVVWAVHHLKEKELVPPSAIQGRYVSCMSRCMCKDRGQLELVGVRV